MWQEGFGEYWAGEGLFYVLNDAFWVLRGELPIGEWKQEAQLGDKVRDNDDLI